MARKKITVVGAGCVGLTCAQRLTEMGLGDVVHLSDAEAAGGASCEAASGSDIVVIASGVLRGAGMSRDDLLHTNAGIVRGVAERAAEHSPNAILIVASDPLEALCRVALAASGFPKHRVIGMAGVLDSARMRALIAQALSVSMESVHAMVLGGRGDALVPLPRFSTVAGIPITELLSREKIEAISRRARDGGAEIAKPLKAGAVDHGPSAAVAEMVRAIVEDKNRVLPASVLLEGEYGVDGVFVGVPCKLGARGLVEVLQLNLTVDERMALQRSASAARELAAALR